MARLLRPASLMSTFLAVTACGGSNAPASPPAAGAGGAVTGRERFGWTQAGSPSDVTLYQYAVYVDGNRRVLEDVACAPSGSDAFDCSAPLPSMTPGQHTLAVGTFIAFGDAVLESSRSAPLQITVTASTASAAAAAAHSGAVVSSDGAEFSAEILARDLNDPVDVAVDATGRAFVAERSGGLRIITPGADGANDAAGDRSLPPDGQPLLLSIVLAPDFTDTRHLYVMHARRHRDGSEVHLARVRESNGALGEAAVLASYIVRDEEPVGVLRFGPERVLYAGLGASGSGDEAQQPGSDGGKILRLHVDGTTPRDNPRSSPVYTLGHRDPRGLAWHPSDGTLWEAENTQAAGELNAIRAGANYGWPLTAGRAGTVNASITLPAELSGLTIVTDRTSPLFGDLIVSSRNARDLFRFRIGAGDGTGAPPVLLLQGRFGAIAQVHAGPDGALYFVTDNRETWGAGRDLLVRLVPRTR